jgi:membrane protein required for colicin V production
MMIDLAALLLLLYGFYLGYTRGIIKTVFALVSILVGIVAALTLSPVVIGWMQGLIQWHPGLVFVLGFALTFIASLVIIRFIGKKVEDLMKFAQVNFINKLAGGVILGILFLVFYSYALWGINSFNLLSDKNKQSSVSYEYLETLPVHTQGLLDQAKPVFRGFWDKMVETFDMIREEEEVRQ